MSYYNFVRSGRNFTIFFCLTHIGFIALSRLDFVAIFIDFKDICAQSRKLL